MHAEKKNGEKPYFTSTTVLAQGVTRVLSMVLTFFGLFIYLGADLSWCACVQAHIGKG